MNHDAPYISIIKSDKYEGVGLLCNKKVSEKFPHVAPCEYKLHDNVRNLHEYFPCSEGPQMNETAGE